MITFIEYLAEAYLDEYSGKKLISTIHYGQRSAEREADLPVIKHIFRKAVDNITAHDYGDQEDFLFYSKKYNRAVVFAYRKDTYNKRDKTKHLIAVTILPIGKKIAKPGTLPVMVEGYSNEFITYLNTFISLEERTEHPLSHVIREDVDFYFYDGQLQNIPFAEFFEVE